MDAAGVIGEEMRKGNIPELMTRKTVDVIAPAFCICSIPRGSKEQRELIRFLFAQHKKLQLPDSIFGLRSFSLQLSGLSFISMAISVTTCAR
jgi:hypothetical protein